jgi:hypothetical protein
MYRRPTVLCMYYLVDFEGRLDPYTVLPHSSLQWGYFTLYVCTAVHGFLWWPSHRNKMSTVPVLYIRSRARNYSPYDTECAVSMLHSEENGRCGRRHTRSAARASCTIYSQFCAAIASIDTYRCVWYLPVPGPTYLSKLLLINLVLL